jgi:integrase
MGRTRRLEGIEARTGKDRLTYYRGTAYAHGRREKGPWTADAQEAIDWRLTRLDEARRGVVLGDRLTFEHAVELFTAGIASGAIRNRSGRQFKPSVIRDYRRHLAVIVGLVGSGTQLDRFHVQQAQRLLDQIRGQGLSDSRTRNVMAALSSLYRWAIPRGYATANPVVGLQMPIADERARERIASVEECRLLLGALSVPYRTALALACYAGLRAGEILALDWEHVDLDGPALWVEWSMDLTTGEIVRPKSQAGRRTVPVADALQAILEDHRDTCTAAGPLFPALRPRRGHEVREGARMSHSGLVKHMVRSWTACDLEPLGLHEARHTFASMMIAVGASPKAIQTYMGHSSITVTFDRYGHLMPGHEAEVLALLNAYHETGVGR